MKKLFYLLEYILLCPFIFICGRLKMEYRQKIAVYIGRYIVYFVFLYLLKSRYNIFVKNLNIIHSKPFSQKEYKRFLKEYCVHTATLFLESFVSHKLDKEWIANNVSVDKQKLDPLLALHKSGEKIIIFSIHLGNWELAHHYLTDILGVNVAVIYRAQNNKYIERFITKARSSTTNIDKKEKNSLREIITSLNSGHILLALLDQRDLANGEEIAVCGTQAVIPTALARLAIKHKCYIVGGVSVRNQNKIHFFLENILSPRDIQTNTPKEVTQLLYNGFSTFITKYTTQWYCLMHDLWKR